MRRTLSAGLAVTLLSACGGSGPELTTGATRSAQIVPVAATMTELLNAERAQNSRTPLRRNMALDAAATAHAADMAARGYFDHTAPDGSTPQSRASRQGYRACLIAENIAQGYASEAQVVAGWMRSSGHRRNILLRDVTEFGAGRGSGDLWVLLLAQPGC